ncbi:MAG TPA: CHAT domain-containing protein [Blastocatellia bacterium]|nr:CHAT domain-containing protein [Blastocatellia bacterium]
MAAKQKQAEEPLHENEEHKQNLPRGVYVPRRVVWMVIALVAALTAILIFVVESGGSKTKRGTEKLISVFKNRRPIAARLSGGFQGGRFDPSPQGFNVVEAKIQDARNLITQAVAAGEPGSELAYGRLLILDGKAPESSVHLNAVVKSSPDNAEAHNDLAVALIQQGQLEDALEETDRALSLNAVMPEARFNKALCYQLLLLRDAAAAAFADVLEVDRDKTWSVETEQRKTEQSAPLTPRKREAEIVAAFDDALINGREDNARGIVADNTEIMVKHAFLKCSTDYLTETTQGDAEKAQRALAELEFIGKEFMERQGDSSVSDLANYLRSLPPPELQHELSLIDDYAATGKLLNTSQYAGAHEAYERLGNEFARRGNEVFQVFATFNDATCFYAARDIASSNRLVNESLAISGKHRWPYRDTLQYLQLINNYSAVGQDSVAIKYGEEALKSSKGLRILQSFAYQSLAVAYNDLGDLDKALSCLRESTKLFLSTVPTFKEVAADYESIAQLYQARANHSLALLYARQALEFAKLAGDNSRCARVSAFCAVESANVNLGDQADEQLGSAFDYVAKTGEGQRPLTEALVQTWAGDIAALRSDSAKSLECYSKAEAILERLEGNALYMVNVRLSRSSVNSSLRDYQKAHTDLERAISDIEGYRERITSVEDRRKFFDAEQGAFDQLIALDIDGLDRKEEAFNYAEQSRGRTLLEESAGKVTADGTVLTAAEASAGINEKPAKLTDVQRQLPPDLRLITYSVTSRGTYLFLVTKTDCKVVRSPATTETFDRLVHQYVAGLSAKAPIEDLSDKSRELYEYLIKPVEALIGDGKTLCIVQDKALHFLPFGALLNKTGQYLIESYRITYAPSATALLQCLKQGRNDRVANDENILAIGDPHFNRQKFPTLFQIPDAEREAVQAAGFYSRRLVLNGLSATKAEVLSRVKDYDVLHLALHCLVEEKSPWLAALVLATPERELSDQADALSQSARSNELLTLSELYKVGLPRTRLVVLSACQSGLGRYYRGEGIVSLVRPFLALRVPTVVASLWSVDSRASAVLMIDFHRARTSANSGAGDALRVAQNKMMHTDDYRHPYYWAPFIAIGSNK